MAVTTARVDLRRFTSICCGTLPDLSRNISRHADPTGRTPGPVASPAGSRPLPSLNNMPQWQRTRPSQVTDNPIWSTHEQARPQAPLSQGQSRQPRPQAQFLSRITTAQDPRSRKGTGGFLRFRQGGSSSAGLGGTATQGQAGQSHAKGEVCRVVTTRHTSPFG